MASWAALGHSSPCFVCRSLQGDAAPPQGEAFPLGSCHSPFLGLCVRVSGSQPQRVPAPDSSTSSHILFTHQAMPRPLTSGSDGQMFCAGEELIEAAKRNDFCKVPVSLALSLKPSPWAVFGTCHQLVLHVGLPCLGDLLLGGCLTQSSCPWCLDRGQS